MIIIDADGAERSWAWVKIKYNLPPILETSREQDHWEVIELHEQIGNSSMTVRIVGDEIFEIAILFGWPDGSNTQFTNREGHTGFGMGGGAYYDPKTEHGPHYVFVDMWQNSDTINGLGMLGKTNHAHLEPTFQFIKGEIEPPPDCEEYISALERIREIVDDLCPGALI